MEGDLIAHINQRGCLVISIHSLRMEGDVERSCTQSREVHFNPLPPHGGRRTDTWQSHAASAISIHSLRMEGDRARSTSILTSLIFQSTPSAWRETQACSFFKQSQTIISIHSLRMEGDNMTILTQNDVFLFQSTPSAWRETLMLSFYLLSYSIFQSTPSAWRETWQACS